MLLTGVGDFHQCSRYGGTIRETREGWPLLTVETEVNGDSKSTNEKGPFLVGSLGYVTLHHVWNNIRIRRQHFSPL